MSANCKFLPNSVTVKTHSVTEIMLCDFFQRNCSFRIILNSLRYNTIPLLVMRLPFLHEC